MTELRDKYIQGYSDGVSDLRNKLLVELHDVLEHERECYNNGGEQDRNIKGWIEALEMVKHSLLKDNLKAGV